MQALQSPRPFFSDRRGAPLANGFLYFGDENDNPETSPVVVYWDSAGTQPAAQPVRTLNGAPSRNGTPALIYYAAPVSITVKDRNGALLDYIPSTRPLTVGFINPMTTAGDLIVGGSGGNAGRLGIGADGQVLAVVGSVLAWVDPVTGFANPMTATGDLIKGGALGVAQRLAPGTDGDQLTMVGGAPGWVTPPVVTVDSFIGFTARRTTPDLGTAGTIVYQDTTFTGGYVDSVSATPVYNVANGKFTAPAIDTYDLDTDNSIHNGSGGDLDIHLQLKINGAVIVTKDVAIADGQTAQLGFHMSLKLALHDVVEIASPDLGGGVVVFIDSTFSMRTATK